MSREIKYRQAVFLHGKFHNWHYWGFIEGCFDGPASGGVATIKDAFENSEEYTGLKDKNSVEIYEGDIVKFKYSNQRELYTAEVRWGLYGWSLIHPQYAWFQPKYLQSCVVIGNIYLNKELLDNE